MLKGAEFSEVRDAILNAFDADGFDMFLYERLEFNRPVEIEDGPFKRVVTQTLQVAERSGWDAILIAEVAAARPLKQEVQRVYAKYAAALSDEGRKREIAEATRKALERFRLGPDVIVQSKGVARSPVAVPGNEFGLERAVKPYLGMIDVGLWRERLFTLEGRVCRVEVDQKPIGTGFLVGPDTVLTNYHVLQNVIADTQLADAVKFRFDYRLLANGSKSTGTTIGLHQNDWLIDYTPFTWAEADNRPDDAQPTLDELDFALVRLSRPFGAEPLRGPDGGNPRGWILVPTGAPPMPDAMPLLILQHPNTLPLKLAVDTAGVLSRNANGTRVRYATNTEPGSSGSPCFNIDWQLVALHHYGDPLHDQATYNQGVPIGMIRDRLRRKNLEPTLGKPEAA